MGEELHSHKQSLTFEGVGFPGAAPLTKLVLPCRRSLKRYRRIGELRGSLGIFHRRRRRQGGRLSRSVPLGKHGEIPQMGGGVQISAEEKETKPWKSKSMSAHGRLDADRYLSSRSRWRAQPSAARRCTTRISSQKRHPHWGHGCPAQGGEIIPRWSPWPRTTRMRSPTVSRRYVLLRWPGHP